MPKTHHAMTTCNHTIPDRSPPRSTRTTPSAVHQDRGVKCATGASSIEGIRYTTTKLRSYMHTVKIEALNLILSVLLILTEQVCVRTPKMCVHHCVRVCVYQYYYCVSVWMCVNSQVRLPLSTRLTCHLNPFCECVSLCVHVCVC